MDIGEQPRDPAETKCLALWRTSVHQTICEREEDIAYFKVDLLHVVLRRLEDAKRRPSDIKISQRPVGLDDVRLFMTCTDVMQFLRSRLVCSHENSGKHCR